MQIEPAHSRATGRKATCLARLGAFDAAVACLEEQRDAGRMPDLDDRVGEVLKQKAAYDKVRRDILRALCSAPWGCRPKAGLRRNVLVRTGFGVT